MSQDTTRRRKESSTSKAQNPRFSKPISTSHQALMDSPIHTHFEGDNSECVNPKVVSESFRQVQFPQDLKYYAGAAFENSPPASQLPMPPAWMLSKKNSDYRSASNNEA